MMMIMMMMMMMMMMKGLNVFNTALTLAKPSTATDDNYERIESVIGHEVRAAEMEPPVAGRRVSW